MTPRACGIGSPPCGAPAVAVYLTGPCCAEHTPAAQRGRPEPGRTRGHTPAAPPPPAPRHFPDDDALECVHCRRPVAPVNVALFGAAEHLACVPPPAYALEAIRRHYAAQRAQEAA